LTGQLAADEQPDYLSGLLIGHEIAGLEAVLARRNATLSASEPRLVGSDALCERYRIALAQFGCTKAQLVRHASERGLWRIAAQAGLVMPR
jgi:2-dehydro-3-deoxygalactonokinase